MPSRTSRFLTRGRPGFLTVGSLGKCFFSNLHNLPGIRYLLFDFVLSFDHGDVTSVRWIVANPVLSGFVSSFNSFSDRFLTDNQRDILRWIVQKMQEGNLAEEFTFVYLASGDIRFMGRGVETYPMPLFSRKVH